MEWNAAIWLVALALPFLFIQRRLHNEIILLTYLITRHAGVSQIIFSIIFLPGVLLHELSHLIMAWLLRVRTGRFSILPSSLPGGRLRLGYVETEPSDFVRDTLIGAAPLITGGIAITLIGSRCLGLGEMTSVFTQNDWANFFNALLKLPKQPDFWLWFYLAFAISSTMLPSASDRRSWVSFGLVLGGLIGLSLLLGAGPWLADKLGHGISQMLYSITLVIGISLLLHFILLVPVYTLRMLFNRYLFRRLKL